MADLKKENKVLKKENKVLTKALKGLTTAYVKVIDLFIEVSMENVGLKPKGAKHGDTSHRRRI